MRFKYKINIFVITIFVGIFFTIFTMNVISKRTIPILMERATSEIKNASIGIINSTIRSELENFDNNLITITKNNENDIQMIDFNPKVVNSILTNLTNKILEELKAIEDSKKKMSFNNSYIGNEMIYEIPLGRSSNNVFIANLGPKIPVKISIIGDVYSNIKTNIKEYGINNALLEIVVKVTVTERVLMPFISNEINITVEIPVSIQLIQGNIPKYYGGGISKNSNILSIPVE